MVDKGVRDGLHDCGCQSVERYTTSHGTHIWSCDKYTCFYYKDDMRLDLLTDSELIRYLVGQLRRRIRQQQF